MHDYFGHGLHANGVSQSPKLMLPSHSSDPTEKFPGNRSTSPEVFSLRVLELVHQMYRLSAERQRRLGGGFNSLVLLSESAAIFQIIKLPHTIQ